MMMMDDDDDNDGGSGQVSSCHFMSFIMSFILSTN